MLYAYMLPPLMLAMPLFVMLSVLAVADSMLSLVISHLTITLPLAVWLLWGLFKNFPVELEEAATLVRLGIPARDALLAGTRWGAEACRIDNEVGTIEVGKRADLIAIDGNPLTDIGAMERVRLVMTDGTIYDGLSSHDGLSGRNGR